MAITASMVKELREKKGISQKELADYLNITQVQISKYELGKNEPDLNTTKKIAEYFNVTIDYLLGTSEENIILITKNDLETLKDSANKINKIVEKLTNNSNVHIGNNSNVQIGSNISYNKEGK